MKTNTVNMQRDNWNHLVQAITRLSPIDKTVIIREDYGNLGRNIMPVNMDPSKKRRRPQPAAASAAEDSLMDTTSRPPRRTFGEDTEADREKDLAEAELKNLWDATEVIDMDKV